MSPHPLTRLNRRDVRRVMRRSPFDRVEARRARDAAISRVGARPGALWKRLSELRRKGWIEEAETRTCDVSGRRAITWRARNYGEPVPGEIAACRICGRMFFHDAGCEGSGG